MSAMLHQECKLKHYVVTYTCSCELQYKGGWKYINDNTGAFFTNEKDVKQALDKLLYEIKPNPRKYYLENWGQEKRWKKIKSFYSRKF